MFWWYVLVNQDTKMGGLCIYSIILCIWLPEFVCGSPGACLLCWYLIHLLTCFITYYFRCAQYFKWIYGLGKPYMLSTDSLTGSRMRNGTMVIRCAAGYEDMEVVRRMYTTHNVGSCCLLFANKRRRWQSPRGQHGAHLGPVSPRWAPCWAHEPCYQGT